MSCFTPDIVASTLHFLELCTVMSVVTFYQIIAVYHYYCILYSLKNDVNSAFSTHFTKTANNEFGQLLCILD